MAARSRPKLDLSKLSDSEMDQLEKLTSKCE